MRGVKRKRDNEPQEVEDVVLWKSLSSPNMLGYLQCPICMEVFEDPVCISPCGHTFCKKCHDKLMPRKCPLDRKPITTTTPNLQIISLLSEVKCKCDFPECRKIMPVTQRHAHLKFCEYRRIDCPYNCGESMIAKNLDVHKGYCRSLMQRGGKVMLELLELGVKQEAYDEIFKIVDGKLYQMEMFLDTLETTDEDPIFLDDIYAEEPDPNTGKSVLCENASVVMYKIGINWHFQVYWSESLGSWLRAHKNDPVSRTPVAKCHIVKIT